MTLFYKNVIKCEYLCSRMNDKLVEIIVKGLQDSKARDIEVIDMSHIEEAACTYFVICEGTSSAHVYGIADNLMDYVKENTGERALGTIGMQNRLWVAIDYGYVIVHIFQPETRHFYRLDELWADAVVQKITEE